MLNINTEFRKGIMFVRLNGELTSDTVNIFEDKIIKCIKKLKISRIVFNLSELEKIDFKGINNIFYAYELCKNNKGKSLMCGNNNNIKKKIQKSRLLNYVYEVNDELTAIRLIKWSDSNG